MGLIFVPGWFHFVRSLDNFEYIPKYRKTSFSKNIFNAAMRKGDPLMDADTHCGILLRRLA